MTNEYDYSDDAGAGFPEIIPLSESKVRELRQFAAQILAARYLLTKVSNKRIWNMRAKDIKAAEKEFAYKLIIEHGLQHFSWPDGLTVRIERPLLQSGRVWDSTIPMQVIFNR